MSRSEAIADFLARAGWRDAQGSVMAGDASARRFRRLVQGGISAVLMEDPTGNVGAFLHIAHHLKRYGLSAPRIFAADQPAGLVLMEDLGDDLIAICATRDPSLEAELYSAATSCLVALHSAPLPIDISPYGAKEMSAMISPLAEFYAPAIGHRLSQERWAELVEALEMALQQSQAPAPVLIHRDYHAENLLWLPHRNGPARIGLIDFQDALAGHPAYDLASLLRDVRRDIPDRVTEDCIQLYCRATGTDESWYRAGFAAQSAQRNLRILGLFPRLCMKFGKPGYLAFMPRVWAHIQADLAHPSLRALRNAVARCIPEPTPERLEKIRRSAA